MWLSLEFRHKDLVQVTKNKRKQSNYVCLRANLTDYSLNMWEAKSTAVSAPRARGAVGAGRRGPGRCGRGALRARGARAATALICKQARWR